MIVMVLNELLVLEPASAQGEHGWIDITWHIQRGAQSETSACTQGEYEQQKVYQRREYLGLPFALDVKGGE